MKVRFDFVTNSSSSNYTIALKVEDVEGNEYILEDDPYDFDPEQGGHAYFLGDLKAIPGKYYDVQSLLKFLARSVDDEFSTEVFYDDEDDYYENNQIDYKEKLESKRKDFIESASDLKSIKDIRSISVLSEYSAWGEFGIHNEYNDDELLRLAKHVVDCDGSEKDMAIEALVKYMDHPNLPKGKNEYDELYGTGCANFRYSFPRHKEAVVSIAKSLAEGKMSNVEGHIIKALDLEKGEYFEEAVFDLKPLVDRDSLKGLSDFGYITNNYIEHVTTPVPQTETVCLGDKVSFQLPLLYRYEKTIDNDGIESIRIQNRYHGNDEVEYEGDFTCDAFIFSFDPENLGGKISSVNLLDAYTKYMNPTRIMRLDGKPNTVLVNVLKYAKVAGVEMSVQQFGAVIQIGDWELLNLTSGEPNKGDSNSVHFFYHNICNILRSVRVNGEPLPLRDMDYSYIEKVMRLK